jgi:hypothetical protein
VIKAAGTVRGQLIGGDEPNQSTALRDMKVPKAYAKADTSPTCYQFQPDVAASCQGPWVFGSTPTHAATYVGRYPPFYYFVVGLPTLVTTSEWGWYAMRSISALICAIFAGLALAVAAVHGRSRLLPIAVGVAATPLLLFLSAIINPSGMEMASGLCMWAAGLVIVLDHIEAPPRAAVGALVASGAALAISRSISPLWVGIVLGVMFLLDPRGIIARLREPGPFRKGVVALVAVCAVAGVYGLITKTYAIFPAGGAVPPGSSTLHILRLALDRTDMYYRQFIGVFGYLDTHSPAVTVVIWTVLLIALVVAGLIMATWRQRACMVLIGIAIIAIPTVISSSHARVDGIVWQARYSYPLDVGLLLLAAAVLTRGPLAAKRVVRPVAVVTAVAIAVAQYAGWFQALRRYVVGQHGTLRFAFTNPRGAWQPPLPAIVLVIATAIVIVVYAAWLVLLAVARPEGRTAPGPRADGRITSDRSL